MLGVLLLATALASPPAPADPAADQAAFEAWVQPDYVEALEILLAAPSSRHPASLWGHVLLRVRYRPDVPSPPGFAPVFQIGVEEAAPGDELAHTARGVFGRLEAKLFVTPSHRVERRYRAVEGRGLKVFELDLDAAERRRVLERLWIASRDSHRWRYAFFTGNCAGLLAELIGPALGPELELDSASFIRWPSSTLDLLARARRPDGRPLLKYAGEEPGSVDRALEATRTRTALGEELRAAGAPVDGVESQRLADRANAYASLAEWAAEQPGAADDAAAFLSESVDIELAVPRRRAKAAGRRAVVDALGDALASLPPPPPRAVKRHVAPAATGSSGAYVARAAGGAHVEDGLLQRPFVELDIAVLEERLGDVRERGFRPDMAVRLLGGRVRVESRENGSASVRQHEWTFASLDSVRAGAGPSVALSGWGDASRGVAASGFAEAGGAVAASSRDGASLVWLRSTAAAGIASPSETHTVVPAASAGARIGARARIGAVSLDCVELVAETRALASDTRHGWIGHAEIALAKSLGRRDRPSVFRLSVRGTVGPGLHHRSSPAPEATLLLAWQLP
jgi:hypothetical protein